MDKLLVPGVLDSLDEIGRFVTAAAREAGLDSKAAYRLRLASDEIATNIITHGYQEQNRSGDVLISAQIEAERLVITLDDTAVPFDPRQLAAVETLELPLEERPLGGLGVFLVLKSVDDFRYERVDKVNRNVLIMKLPATNAGG